VPDHVGQRLLNDPVRGQRGGRRHRGHVPGQVHVHRYPRRADHRRETVQVAETRRGSERGNQGGGCARGGCGHARRGWARVVGFVVAAQQAQQAPQFVERATAGLLDRTQRPECLVGTGRSNPAADARLNGNDAQAVGEHVMQFPGDPQPLLLE
jgi:hypothetical protein